LQRLNLLLAADAKTADRERMTQPAYVQLDIHAYADILNVNEKGLRHIVSATQYGRRINPNASL
jgi:hypothetical protein